MECGKHIYGADRTVVASRDSGANCAILLPSFPRLINATTTTGCTIIQVIRGACLSLAVSHGCTNTEYTRRQRLSNLNRTSAFVCRSLNHHRCVCVAAHLLLNQRDGEEQQVASTLHKYLHIRKGQTAEPVEIYRLEAEESIRFLPGHELQSSACTQGTRQSDTSQLLVNG